VKQQVNRQVQVNCVPGAPAIFLTTTIILGIVGACPAVVSYQADVSESSRFLRTWRILSENLFPK
jgi:hypothetical protein